MITIDNQEVIKNLRILKERMKSVSMNPSFEKDLDFYSKKNPDKEYKFGFNCYAYAMQFPIEYSEAERYFQAYYRPGFLVTKSFPILDYQTLIDLFIRDCDELGYNHEFVDLNAPVEKDSYKIRVYYSRKMSDYHFLRQNSDGVWSSKGSWSASPQIEKFPTMDVGTYIPVETVRISRK